jgi:hypothetical protein
MSRVIDYISQTQTEEWVQSFGNIRQSESLAHLEFVTVPQCQTDADECLGQISVDDIELRNCLESTAHFR